MPATRIALITTLKHNVGDDFVRSGIIYILRKVFGRLELSFIHKHLPITSRPEFEWFHNLGVSNAVDSLSTQLSLKITRRVDNLLPLMRSDKVTSCDVLVQSGAPVYWLGDEGNCAENEWWEPLMERRWLSGRRDGRFLNLAAGACQRWGSDGKEFKERTDVMRYVSHSFDTANLTTVRDTLSKRILSYAGREAVVLPCTSIFAINENSISPSTGDYVVLNYMHAGGHYTLGQESDPGRWEETFRQGLLRISRKHRCLLVCHNHKELALAKRLFPDVKRFWSGKYEDYLAVYSQAKWGVFNRVHGAFALASLGKPSIIVGSDSRSEMAELIGLRSSFVGNVDANWLYEQIDHLESTLECYPEIIAGIKSDAERRYVGLIRESV